MNQAPDVKAVDLVARLRADADEAEGFLYRHHARRLREAADEIERLRNALARIAYSDAQNGNDAMKIRNIATAILHPEKANIYDPQP